MEGKIRMVSFSGKENQKIIIYYNYCSHKNMQGYIPIYFATYFCHPPNGLSIVYG